MESMNSLQPKVDALHQAVTKVQPKVTTLRQDVFEETYLRSSKEEREEMRRIVIEKSHIGDKFFIPVDFNILNTHKEILNDLLVEYFKRKGIDKIDVTALDMETRKKAISNFGPEQRAEYRRKYIERHRDEYVKFAEKQCALEGIDLETCATAEERESLISHFEGVFDPFVEINKQNIYKLHNSWVIDKLKSYEDYNDKKLFKYYSYDQMQGIYVDGTIKEEDTEPPKNYDTAGYVDVLKFSEQAFWFEIDRDETIATGQSPKTRVMTPELRERRRLEKMGKLIRTSKKVSPADTVIKGIL